MKRATFVRTVGAGMLATGVQRPRTGAAADRIPLRVGTTPIDASATPYYAQQLGFYDRAGLDVQVTTGTNGGSPLLAAMLGGQLDICITSTAAMILAREHGVQIRYFSPASVFIGPRPPNSALLVAKDSPIRSVPDIRGKTIAVSALNDLTQYCVQAWIGGGGGDPTAVRYIELPYAAMAPALAEGRVDAICQPEPFLTEAKSVARVLVSLDDVIGQRYLIAGWMATVDWLESHPEARDRFVTAMQRVARWTNTHRAQSGAMLVQIAKIDPRVVAAMTRAVQDESNFVDPKLLQPPLNMMITYGGVTPSLTAADLVWPLESKK